MKTISCGIDFGTSNSSIAVDLGDTVRLIPVENESITMPSAIFFQQRDNKAVYGRAAVRRFLDRSPAGDAAEGKGRFMRSLKRVLGTPLMKQGTLVNGASMNFATIIAGFLAQLKATAERQVGQPIEQVVMGRPVHFIDNDPAADAQAQAELKAIAQRIGFKAVEFQFEPIAAAFAHETRLTGEKLALVVDLGGGTSDFTVIRLSNEFLTKTDRASDILANTGVRIGGNDFDKELSLAAVMPELGYRSVYGEKRLEVPLKPYHDLAEWSKVNFLYTPRQLTQVRQLLHQSHDKARFGRLLRVLEEETGHTLLAATESAKIGLTDAATYQAPLPFIEPDFAIPVTQALFEQAIRDEVAQISASAEQCLREAGVGRDAIDLVILTGGSTEIRSIQAEFRRLFPNADLADQDKLSSVGLGLAYDSRIKFGKALA